MLNVNSLTVGYDETKVIRDLSLTVADDEMVAILGRNGMGKTTLLNCLTGTLDADSGHIEFEGKDITSVPAHKRAKLGMTLIPQGRDIFPDLTVEENLKMGIYGAEGKDEIGFEDVFEYFPILEERLKQKGGTLSGGQQQMLAIARGLLTNPRIIFLDEPSEGIQPSIIGELGNILPKIHADFGIPVVLVEQNVDLVLSTVERAYILENGKIVEEGTIERLDSEGLIEQYIGI